MKLSASIKPISYLKLNAARLIRDLFDNHGTVIITQDGQPKAVVQDIETYEQTQESLAMLKMLAQSKKNVTDGDYKPLKSAFAEIKDRASQL